MAGLERPRAGRITLGDELWLDTARGVRLPPERRRVGYVPQDYGLFPHLTVAANVRFAAKRDRPDLLERLGISDLARARPRQLSGGERQRVALARALAREPHVLLLDEPFAALDAITRREVRDELADILETLSLPTLLVTHAFDDANALARRIAVLDSGRLAQVATPAELIARPAGPMVAALTGANVLSGTASPAGGGSVVRLKGGGELESATPAAGPVRVAVHPWELEPVDPQSCALTDRVVSIHPEGDALRVRLERFTIHIRPGAGEHPPVREGATIGLHVAPANVRVLSEAGGGTPTA